MRITTGASPRDFVVDMFNPDGSWMGMCGNGIRCVVRFLVLEGLLPIKAEGQSEKISVKVGDRVIGCSYELAAEFVTVNMGAPSFAPADLPIASREELLAGEISGLPGKWSCVSMGNPHAMTFVPELSRDECLTRGPKIEHHPFFPKRTNVEWVQVKDRTHLEVLVWERGAGATLACGTAACAVVVAGARLGLSEPEATVSMPGGDLKVSWQQSENIVYLYGPASEVCQGTLASEFIERITV